jgi:hypothetical protein
VWNASLKRRMPERYGNMEREREIVTPSGFWLGMQEEPEVSLTELRSGSRRGRLPAVRTKIVPRLVENYGVMGAEIVRQVGISTSCVSKILSRTLLNFAGRLPLIAYRARRPDRSLQATK